MAEGAIVFLIFAAIGLIGGVLAAMPHPWGLYTGVFLAANAFAATFVLLEAGFGP